jgi:hypothetical protein
MDFSLISKYLTPQLITLLTVLGILSILLIVSIFLLIIFRKQSIVQKLIWNVKELRNLYTNNPSMYSQKRIKSSVAFYSAEALIIIFDAIHIHTMSASEIAGHAIILFGIAGYHLSKTQEEKLSGINDVEDEDETPKVTPPVVAVTTQTQVTTSTTDQVVLTDTQAPAPGQ